MGCVPNFNKSFEWQEEFSAPEFLKILSQGMWDYLLLIT
jgi:hypothetical protein